MITFKYFIDKTWLNGVKGDKQSVLSELENKVLSEFKVNHNNVVHDCKISFVDALFQMRVMDSDSQALFGETLAWQIKKDLDLFLTNTKKGL